MFEARDVPHAIRGGLLNLRLLAPLLLTCGSLTVGVSGARSAQPPGDAEEFFQRLFGQDTPEDEQALAAVEIAPREERRYGDQAAEAYLKRLKQQGIRVLSRGRDVEYLRRLVETIRPLMRHADRYPRIKVYLADSPRTDARSFPGGTLIFFRGMLEFAESEAALVGVIGHELSHLDHGHQLNHLRRLKLARQSLAGTQSDPRSLMSGGLMAMRMFTRPFRPEDEEQADRDGATWAYRAGYDPRQMAALFLRIHQRDQDQPNFKPDFLRTHPFHLDRQRAVEQTYEELQREAPHTRLYIGRRNLRQRLTRAEQEFDE